MKGQLILETERLGPLEVCMSPPVLLWRGEQQKTWRPSPIVTLGALINEPPVSPEELAERLGMEPGTDPGARLSDLRNAISLSGLPVRVVAVKEDESRRLIGYRLEILG